MHADHLLGRDPLMGRLSPSGFPAVVRIAASLHIMHRSFVSWVSPFWCWGCGLKTTFLYLLLLSGMPRPEASTPLPCRLLLCRLLHGYPWPAKLPERLYYAKPGRRPRPWTLKTLLPALQYVLVDPSLGVPPR